MLCYAVPTQGLLLPGSNPTPTTDTNGNVPRQAGVSDDLLQMTAGPSSVNIDGKPTQNQYLRVIFSTEHVVCLVCSGNQTGLVAFGRARVCALLRVPSERIAGTGQGGFNMSNHTHPLSISCVEAGCVQPPRGYTRYSGAKRGSSPPAWEAFRWGQFVIAWVFNQVHCWYTSCQGIPV